MNLVEEGHKYLALWIDRSAQPWFRFAFLTTYYLAILIALVALYGQGNFSTPPFIYQNF
jgi:D-Ala-teichoic acid biosynthesis protein